MKAQLQKAAAFFADRKVDEGMQVLAELLDATARDAPARDQLLAWVGERVGDEHPQVGAHIALMGGALVENGASPVGIGRAIVAPVLRALTDAARMFAHAREHGHQHGAEEGDEEHDHGGHSHDQEDADHDHAHSHSHSHSHENDNENDNDNDNDGDHVHVHDNDNGDDNGHADDDHSHSLEIGGWALSDDDLRTIAAKDVAAVRAWFSLEMWYRPAVACWSRDRSLLREVQGNRALRDALARIGRATETSHWLSVLIETLVAAPLVVLVPELGEAWRMTADGVVDMGQLTVLASKALADPIARIGGSGVATDEELDVMTGEAPQSGGGGYSSSFAFYPPEACDPEDALPRDGIHLWSAPGGTGTHSLPGDFLPGTLPESDGARVLVMVGPKAPGMRFVRIIQSSRMFEALTAKITDVTQLSAAQAKALLAIARERGRAARA